MATGVIIVETRDLSCKITVLTAEPVGGPFDQGSTFSWAIFNGFSFAPISGATGSTYIPTGDGSYNATVTEGSVTLVSAAFSVSINCLFGQLCSNGQCISFNNYLNKILSQAKIYIIIGIIFVAIIVLMIIATFIISILLIVRVKQLS